ncbi:MAG: DNA-3-methyladenine glycosylase I [Micrococcales bacterium]
MAHSLTYPDGLMRCAWPHGDELYTQYHDTEWGVPLRGDNAMFERVALEGFQAGLSWITILKRREGFRQAFHNFEMAAVAQMTNTDVDRLMQDAGIIRNRAKILATIKNAQLALDLPGGLSDFVWQFAPERGSHSTSVTGFEWVATSTESEALSKALKKQGFSFVGATTMYALMQATGMLNDHAPECFRRAQLS